MGCCHEVCGLEGVPATLTHIFLACPVAVEVWGWVRRLWVAVTGGSLPPATPAVLLLGDRRLWDPGRTGSELLWHRLRLAAIYFLWMGRGAGPGPVRFGARRIGALLVAHLRHELELDILRLGGMEVLREVAGGTRLSRRRQLTREAFEGMWCARGVLCCRQGDGWVVRLSASFPVPIP